MSFIKNVFILVIGLLLTSPLLQAQNSENNTTKTATKSTDKLKFTPILAPSYSPEVKLMLNAGGLLTFKIQPQDSLLPRSSLPFTVGYSTNTSLTGDFRPYIYGNKNKIRLFGNISFKNFPDNYWGVGYENGRDVPKSDTTTLYQRVSWRIDLNLVWRVKSHLFAGFKVDLNKTDISDLNDRMKEDPNVIEFGPKIRNSGFGLIVQYDSRDLGVNAYSGLFISLTTTFYGNYLNGENKYSIYELDYRQFKEIKRPARTLAWQIKSRLGGGNVPWPEMSQLGTPFDLRGYTWGRFRDRQMLFGLVEYRHMFIRKRPNKKGRLQSKSGFVTWVGTGSIAPVVRDFKYWLPNFGVGYRFEVQSRMNARLDFGFGENSNGFYVSFNEAF